ncbi:uncharacterized protein L201_002747 [Kwoniella dendrophila CBS 6074]|uniref:Phosphatidylglycerol/phosphatidylinositol transfer protein n=1 Tax=Kwoniella dendrophila CBS 6074 TaxID=1295534 RepID=A0AAX4JR07_9TREE
MVYYITTLFTLLATLTLSLDNVAGTYIPSQAETSTTLKTDNHNITSRATDIGHVKVIFPPETYSTCNDDGFSGGLRDFTLVNENKGDQAKIEFFWYGPKTTEQKLVNGIDGFTLNRPWTQICEVSAIKGFEETIEYTLRLDKTGLEGPKNHPYVHIKCEEYGCFDHLGCSNMPVIDSNLISE